MGKNDGQSLGPTPSEASRTFPRGPEFPGTDDTLTERYFQWDPLDDPDFALLIIGKGSRPAFARACWRWMPVVVSSAPPRI